MTRGSWHGVCVVTEDGRTIVELSGITKTNHGYERKAQIPQNIIIKVPDVTEFLDGFKHIYGFRNKFLFVKSEGMHFDGIGKRMEEADELYHS